MNFSIKDVANLALKRTPADKWCFLWVQPVNNTLNLQAFSLIPPFLQKSWICIGKIKGIEIIKKEIIDSLAERILWTIEMHRSFYYVDPTSS